MKPLFSSRLHTLWARFSLLCFRGNQKGFTLPEMLAAVAISSMVGMFLATSYSDIVSRFLSLRNKSELIQDGIVVSDAISREIMNLDGGIQPLAHLIKVENSCAAAAPLPACLPGLGTGATERSDRLVTFEFNSDLAECQVVAQTNVGSTDPIMSFSVGNFCCLTAEMDNQHFILSADPYFRFGYANIDLNNCTMRLEYSRYSRLGSTPRFDRTTIGGITKTDWQGANLSFVTPYEYYLEGTGSADGNRELKRFSDRNNDNAIDLSANPNQRELDILSDGIFDFQVALGYDLYDQAGTIGASDGVAETQESATDEWLYNHSGDNIAAAPYNSIDESKLRVLGLGFVFSRKRMGPEQTSSVKVFDGAIWQEDAAALANKVFSKEVFYVPIPEL